MKVPVVVLICALIVSCKSEENRDEANFYDHQPTYFADTFQPNSSSNSFPAIELTYTDTIWQLVNNTPLNCENSTEKKINHEDWSYCLLKKALKLVIINKTAENTNFTEKYLIRNGQLIYAIEGTKYPSNVDDLNGTYWNCEYIIKNDTVVDIMSLGHGATESENWNEQHIIQKWRNHTANFNKIKKST